MLHSSRFPLGEAPILRRLPGHVPVPLKNFVHPPDMSHGQAQGHISSRRNQSSEAGDLPTDEKRPLRHVLRRGTVRLEQLFRTGGVERLFPPPGDTGVGGIIMVEHRIGASEGSTKPLYLRHTGSVHVVVLLWEPSVPPDFSTE